MSKQCCSKVEVTPYLYDTLFKYISLKPKADEGANAKKTALPNWVRASPAVFSYLVVVRLLRNEKSRPSTSTHHTETTHAETHHPCVKP